MTSALKNDELRPVHPDLRAAAQLVRSAIAEGTGIPTHIKALFTAAAALNRGFLPEAEEEFAAAHAAGASSAELWAVPNVLMSSRGEGMSRRAARALRAGVPSVADDLPTPDAAEAGITMQRALEIVTVSEQGTLLPQAAVMHAYVPDALRGYALGRDTAWHRNGLSPRHVHLLLVCVNAADYLPQYVRRHGEMAKAEGASDADLVDAVLCAMPYGGVTSWFASAAELPLSDPLPAASTDIPSDPVKDPR